MGPYTGKETGETALFRQLLEQSRRAGSDIVVADRYYCSYFMIALLLQCGVDAAFACTTSANAISAAASAWAATTTLWSGNVRNVPLGWTRRLTRPCRQRSGSAKCASTSTSQAAGAPTLLWPPPCWTTRAIVPQTSPTYTSKMACGIRHQVDQTNTQDRVDPLQDAGDGAEGAMDAPTRLQSNSKSGGAGGVGAPTGSAPNQLRGRHANLRGISMGAYLQRGRRLCSICKIVLAAVARNRVGDRPNRIEPRF